MITTVLRAPFTARPWREHAYVLASLLPAVAAFALSVVGLAASVFSLVGVGLPLLAAVLGCTRVANRTFRAIARAILGWEWASPPALPAKGAIGQGWALLRDPAGWRSLVYCFIKLPLTAVTAYLATYAVFAGALLVTCPIWLLAAPVRRNVLGDHSATTLWFLVAQAVAVALVWPWFLRLMVDIDRRLVHALLEPNTDRIRIAALESSRTLLTADSAEVLRRVERDLHDGTQARLVAIGVAVGRIAGGSADERTRALSASTQTMVTEALDELRDIVRGFHPPALDHGLPTAIETLAARSAVPVEVTVDLRSRPTDATASAFYFSVAELLTNVARHAGATRARLRLEDGGGRIRLVVTDDGRGGATLDGAGTGLAGLARRAAALDGAFDVVSPAGGPTTVTMTLPSPTPQPEALPCVR